VLVLSVILLYQLSIEETKEQLQSLIDVLLAEVLAVRLYTSEEITPILASQSQDTFQRQAVPALERYFDRSSAASAFT
jgi:hypothetical protein